MAKIQSGFNRVVKQRSAVAKVTKTAATLCAAAVATTKPLAAMSPIEIGSRPCWVALQRAPCKRSEIRPT